MNDYQIILKILTDVFSGKNLGDVFNQNIENVPDIINISKIKDISYGVLRNYSKIELIIKELVNKNPTDVRVKIILMIGLYEIGYTKKPPFAVTNELVGLVYNITKEDRLKNFVNAVIRNYLRNEKPIQQKICSSDEFKYNFPQWWIYKLSKDYPNEYKELMQYSSLKPKTSLRVNKRKISQEEYLHKLSDANIGFTLIDDKISLNDNITTKQIPLFNEGYVSIQDISAQKLLDFIKFMPNSYILDACSAPGGKSCLILENHDVNLVSMDISKARLNKVEQNLQRLNLKAELVCGDATNLEWWDKQEFDVILADVPCSASGTIKKNPDIKLHRIESDIANFVYSQRKIVTNLWNTLAINGLLVYITCSIFKEENQDNIKFLTKSLKNSKLIKDLIILPSTDADGFYYALLQKTI